MVGSKVKKWLEDYSISLAWTLVFLVLIANSLLSYFNFRYVAENTDKVKAQYEKMQLTVRIMKLMVDAETGHRGFIITGNKDYLQPYIRALGLLEELLPEFRAVFDSNPQQLESANQVITDIAQKLKEMQISRDLRENKGFPEAQAYMMLDQGKKYMDDIRMLVQVMYGRENDQLAILSQQVEESRSRALAMLIAGTLALIGMSVAAFVLIRQQLKYRNSMEQLLRQTNNELENRVQHRTEALLITNVSLQEEIEERKRLEDKAVKYADDLQNSNKELEQFASVASHDLQEPLRKIQAFSDRLVTKYRDQLDNNGKEYIDRIQFSAGRMRHLIEDLLTFSRVSSRGKPFVPVDLNNIVKGVLVDLELRIHETNADVSIDHLPTIDADELQMRQLFQNLLGNALKFHRPGTTPHLQVKWRSPPDSILDEPTHCELIFSDNGIGFENQYAERIFQLFQRLHGRGEYEGTGMGLAICKKIVERHQGTITAAGIPGEGATFIVRLPISHPSPDRKE